MLLQEPTDHDAELALRDVGASFDLFLDVGDEVEAGGWVAHAPLS